MKRHLAALTAAVAIAAILPSASAAAAATTGSGWTLQSTPLPAGASQGGLSGIECRRAPTCTAVGYYVGSASQDLPLVERWSEGTWSALTAAVPAQADGAALAAVNCALEAVCTTVGSYFSGGEQFPLAEQWSGGTWQAQTSLPLPAGGLTGSLSALSCGSTNHCTAVGTYFDADSPYTANQLVEQWDGSTWSLQPTPTPAGSAETDLFGVSCPTLTSCFAVGESFNSIGLGSPLLESWDGANWTIQPVTTPPGQGGGLDSIWCDGPEQCTAVGGYDVPTGSGIPLAEVLADGTWTAQAPAVPARASGGVLNGVYCQTATQCTAVGQYDNVHDGGYALADHWNGTRWSTQATASPTRYRILQGVACIAVYQCAAAGYITNKTYTKALPLVESTIDRH